MEAYQRLEKEWAELNKLDPQGMVACATGTAALHLAWECSGVEAGHEVVCPDLTMVAVPRAVAMAGLDPCFVDCCDDLNMEPGLVEDVVNYKVRGLCVVHTYGRRARMDGPKGLADLADRYDLFMVEDLSEAHGLPPHAGTDAACWSFYRNKVVAGEEGGAVWFRDPAAAKKARCLRSQGFTAAHDFMHVPRGHNYRLSNLHARAILNSFTNGYADDPRDDYWQEPGNADKCFPRLITSRRQAEADWDAWCPTAWKLPPRDVPWVYDLRIQGMTPTQQDELVAAVQGLGVAARHCFKPMTYQSEFTRKRSLSRGVAAVRSREVIYLPLAGCRTDLKAEQVFSKMRAVVDGWQGAAVQPGMPAAVPVASAAGRTPDGQGTTPPQPAAPSAAP